MKKFKNLFIYTSICASFALYSCEGPMGPAGKDGTNGADGKDVKTVCLVCHTTAKQDALTDQYHLSKHFLGTSSSRNSKYCARCHTSQGFQEITGAGTFAASNDIVNGTRISCETCHQHKTFDFAVDTIAQILRTSSPVYLNYNKNLTTTDFGAVNNLCVTCHQIRGVTAIQYTDGAGKKQSFTQLPFFPLDLTKNPATDSVKFQIATSFSVHDGNQSNLFAGINGYEYPGATYTRIWKHSSLSCTDCHMNEYDPTTKTGGHTLIPNKAKCASCHSSDHIATTQALIDSKIIALRDKLVAKGLFKQTTSSTGKVSYGAVNTHDFFGTLLPKLATPSATLYGMAINSNTVSTSNGLVDYGSGTIKMAVDATSSASTVGSNDRLGRKWSYGELGAAYNYGYINSELSKGVHNPTYALQILQTSIDWLNAH